MNNQLRIGDKVFPSVLARDRASTYLKVHKCKPDDLSEFEFFQYYDFRNCSYLSKLSKKEFTWEVRKLTMDVGLRTLVNESQYNQFNLYIREKIHVTELLSGYIPNYLNKKELCIILSNETPWEYFPSPSHYFFYCWLDVLIPIK